MKIFSSIILFLLLLNETIFAQKVNTMENVVFYPKIEDVFVKVTPEIEATFIPILSITKEIDGKKKTFHIVSIWDTGNYDKAFFNNYRKKVDFIEFDYKDNKIDYPVSVIVPNIDCLPSAYYYLQKYFELNKEWLISIDDEQKSIKNKEQIIKDIKEFGNQFQCFDEFSLGYYYRRVISSFILKERYFKQGVFNNDFPKYKFDFYGQGLKNYDYFTQNKSVNEIHTDKPIWWQQDENYIFKDDYKEKASFICQINSDLGSSDADSSLKLFYNSKNNKVTLYMEWD